MRYQDNTFQRLDWNSDPTPSNHVFSTDDYLRLMNDPKKREQYDQCKARVASDHLSPQRMYNTAEFADFVPVQFLEPILEHVSYASVAGNIANQVSVNTGLTFKYREFENFQRAQRGGENTEFERKRGSRRLNEVPFYTNGLRSYVTEEEKLDLGFDAMRLELNTMAASIALERDLLWMDSLHRATSGSNATTFNNALQTSDELDLQGLHGVITWMTQPFAAATSSIELTNPFTSSTEQIEHLQRLGKFKTTDVILNTKAYWNIIKNTTLQNQQIWSNSRILDTGELQVPLLGVRIWKANIGYFTDADDVNSWIDTDDIFFVDRNAGGGGTINAKQPLQVRNWFDNPARVEDFMVFERVGFAVQNRRALIRVTSGS